MTRPATLIRNKSGVYVPSLEKEIAAVMHPEASVPSRAEMALRAALYCAATVLVGMGVLIGMAVVVGFAGVFWVISKVWRK